jgi:hypothetical protein
VTAVFPGRFTVGLGVVLYLLIGMIVQVCKLEVQLFQKVERLRMTVEK